LALEYGPWKTGLTATRKQTTSEDWVEVQILEYQYSFVGVKGHLYLLSWFESYSNGRVERCTDVQVGTGTMYTSAWKKLKPDRMSCPMTQTWVSVSGFEAKDLGDGNDPLPICGTTCLTSIGIGQPGPSLGSAKVELGLGVSTNGLPAGMLSLQS